MNGFELNNNKNLEQTSYLHTKPYENQISIQVIDLETTEKCYTDMGR